MVVLLHSLHYTTMANRRKLKCMESGLISEMSQKRARHFRLKHCIPLQRCPNYMAVYPPSTGTQAPVIQVFSSEARNSATFARSCGWPIPLKGW